MQRAAADARISHRRSQAQRRDESERLLVEATLAIVAERGVSAATFDSIGNAAGYSRGLASLKFGSKQGLIKAVIGYLHRRRDAMLASDRVAEMSALDAMLHYVDAHLQDLSPSNDERAYFMFLAAAVADASSMRTAFAASHERVRAWLEALVRRGQRDGEICSDLDPAAAALMIGSLLLGITMQWLVDPTTNLEPVRVASLTALRRSFAVARQHEDKA